MSEEWIVLLLVTRVEVVVLCSENRDKILVFPDFANRGKVSATGATEGMWNRDRRDRRKISRGGRKISRGGRKLVAVVEKLVAV